MGESWGTGPGSSAPPGAQSAPRARGSQPQSLRTPGLKPGEPRVPNAKHGGGPRAGRGSYREPQGLEHLLLVFVPGADVPPSEVVVPGQEALEEAPLAVPAAAAAAVIAPGCPAQPRASGQAAAARNSGAQMHPAHSGARLHGSQRGPRPGPSQLLAVSQLAAELDPRPDEWMPRRNE